MTFLIMSKSDISLSASMITRAFFFLNESTQGGVCAGITKWLLVRHIMYGSNDGVLLWLKLVCQMAW
jgi:hypothetical protein